MRGSLSSSGLPQPQSINRPFQMQIQQQTFLVTGAASGLGAATARRLVAEGGRVLLADVDDTAGRALAEELGAAATFQHTDVTREADVKAVVAAAAEWAAPLRGVVHCAGVATAGRVLGRAGPHDLAAFARSIEINLIGTFNVTRLAAAAMAETAACADGERGVIVNTASVAAYDGQIGQAAYSASKGGVAAMTLPMARELARFGIRVMAIAPGIFDTPMVAAMPDGLRQSLAAQIPFPPRFGRPEEFAALAVHIITNRMLNGEVIRLDGAVRMAAK